MTKQEQKLRIKFFKNVGSDEEKFKARTCTVFGCGRHLTYREQLFGDKCISHSGELEIKNTDLINLFLYKKRS